VHIIIYFIFNSRAVIFCNQNNFPYLAVTTLLFDDLFTDVKAGRPAFCPTFLLIQGAASLGYMSQ